jgi:hypothetical protein
LTLKISNSNFNQIINEKLTKTQDSQEIELETNGNFNKNDTCDAMTNLAF